MAIDRFTQARFEAALPKATADGTALPRWRRFENGQFVYKYGVSPNVFINIFSSVDASGFARETAEDSIRFTINDASGAPLSNKLQAYVTRVPNWESRVATMFWKSWDMAQEIAKPCSCGQQRKVFVVKKDGPNKGRRFTRCECGAFVWLDSEKLADSSRNTKTASVA